MMKTIAITSNPLNRKPLLNPPATALMPPACGSLEKMPKAAAKTKIKGNNVYIAARLTTRTNTSKTAAIDLVCFANAM